MWTKTLICSLPIICPRHDLSALRELRTEPAVWRALVDTLVLRYPNKTAPAPTEGPHAAQEARSAPAVTSAAAVANEDGPTAPGASPSRQDGRRNRPSDGERSGAAVLSFRHERRLTLETTCLLMGRAVPVSVFEESRSDFWCEAEVPAALTSPGRAACPVGLRVPKECIPLILDDDHPMRMRTILDASDLRHLSGLIADRLKLCRVGSPRKGPRSYHYWLDGAIGGSGGHGSSEGSAGEAAAAAGSTGTKGRGQDDSGQEFKLSLRKRSIGQVIFSRLVSFWVPSEVVHDSDNGGSRPSRPHIVQRLIIVKEFAHRGECGELRGEVHNPDSGGGMDTLVPTPGLTRMLLGGWVEEMKADYGSENPCARYWRDALTWRLRIASEPTLSCDGIDEELADETEDFDAMKRTARSHRATSDDGLYRLTLDERKPIFSLRRVAVACLRTPAQQGEGEGSGEARSVSNTYFDVMLLLRNVQSGSSRAPTQRQTPAIELVATHRPTLTAFTFSVSANSLAKALDGTVAACLNAPAALSTELQLSASNTVLRGLVAKWLQYSPGNGPRGLGPTLTLNLSLTKPIAAEPYVSLRCSGGKESIYRMRRAKAQDASHATEAGPSISVEECATDRRVRSRETRESAPGSGSRGTRKSIATLQVETRNERMVLRRNLAVPRVRGFVESVRKEGRAPELEPQVLAVSVYEAFTTGSEGKIERHLRFCARDESVRPVVEAVTTIPWVGTCEGIESGRLWRVVTQGLSVECARDNMGKIVGMSLEVATEDGSEDRAVSRHAVQPGPRESSPHTSLCPPEEGSVENGRTATDPKAASGEWEGNDNSNKEEASAVSPISEERTNQEHAVISREQTPSGTTLDEIDGVITPSRLQYDEKPVDAVDGTHERQGRVVCSVDDVFRHMPGPPKGREATGLVPHGAGTCSDQIANVYSGWHRVTGIRLHVQCFQARNHDGAGDLADIATRVKPAGRGGAIEFPRDASLHFLLCDPSTGHRTGVKVSVEDVCRNLSIDGGTVEAGLLDAGRRPALAKAIAEKLRLVFEAGGGYRAVLPLPAEWSRACQPAA